MKYFNLILILGCLTFLPSTGCGQIINVFECDNSDTLWFNSNLVKFPAIHSDYKTYIVELDGVKFVEEVHINEPDCQTFMSYWSKELTNWSYLLQTDSKSLIYWPTTQYEPTKYIMVRTTNKLPIFMEILFR